MIECADYDFYFNNYRGSLSDDLFCSFIPKANHIIDLAVNKELEEADITDKVKFVACELVDYLKEQKDNENNVSSISMGNVSKVFKSKTRDEINKEIADILNGLPHELTRFR